MNLDKVLIESFRSEYKNRVDYFLSERMSVMTKSGINVIAGAEGLKVREKKSGLEYTVVGIVKKSEADSEDIDSRSSKGNSAKEFVKLYLPDVGRVDPAEAESSLNEFGFDRDDDLGYNEDLEYSDGVIDDYEADDYDQNDVYDFNSDKLSRKANNNTVKRKVVKNEKKFVLVPIGEFEERFET